MAILQNCKVFAATEGSIAHNVLFCKKVEKIIILRKARFFTGYQFVANSLHPNAEIIFIDIGFSHLFKNSKEKWGGPFFIYESKALRRYFNLPPKISFPILEFLKYFIYYLDVKFFSWTHPIRYKIKLGTKIRHLFKNPR